MRKKKKPRGLGKDWSPCRSDSGGWTHVTGATIREDEGGYLWWTAKEHTLPAGRRKVKDPLEAARLALAGGVINFKQVNNAAYKAAGPFQSRSVRVSIAAAVEAGLREYQRQRHGGNE